ncbi:MAG: ABC transporter substrate-binding protein [bacterium]
MKKILSLTTFLMLLAITISSCGKKDGVGENKYGLSTKNNVVWWVASDPTNVIPPLVHDAAGQYASQFIWEPLNSVQPRTQELIPWIASLPEMSADHLTYTYTINPKAHFNDGHPVTGEDVMFTFKCVMNPVNAETTQSRSVLESVDSVAYVNGDKMKVAFYLNKPYFQMDRVLGGGYEPIMPKHIFDPENMTDKMAWKDIKKGNSKDPVYKAQMELFNNPDHSRNPKFMIGTGPYIYQEWKTNDHITFKRDDKYWAKDMPWGECYLDQIILKTITDNNAAVTALKAKDIDFMDLVPSALYMQIDTAKLPFIRKDTVYYNSRTYVEWNNSRPLFKSKKVRWALSHLINRDQLVRDIYKGLGRPTNGVINFTQPHYDATLKPIEYNPDLAKSMLAEEGWTANSDGILHKIIDGHDMPFEFTFYLPAGSDVAKQSALVISEAMRKIGIKAEVSIKEWTVWINDVRAHNFDASIANIGGNATEDDPYELWHSSQAKNKGQNVTAYMNPEVDKLLEQNRTSFDFAERDVLMKKFQQIMYEDMPITPLFSQPVRLARLDRFDNVEFYRQRPCISVPLWVVRGSGAKVKPGAVSNFPQ